MLIPTPFVSCLAFSTDQALMIQTIDSSLCPVDSSVAGRMNLEGCRAELKMKKSFTRLSVLQMQAQCFRRRERVTKLSQDSLMSRHNLGRQTSLIISSCYMFHYDSHFWQAHLLWEPKLSCVMNSWQKPKIPFQLDLGTWRIGPVLLASSNVHPCHP